MSDALFHLKMHQSQYAALYTFVNKGIELSVKYDYRDKRIYMLVRRQIWHSQSNEEWEKFIKNELLQNLGPNFNYIVK